MLTIDSEKLVVMHEPMLTNRQTGVLRRIVSLDGRDAIDPTMARQLIKQGLVTRDTMVPAYLGLWYVWITPAGRKIIS